MGNLMENIKRDTKQILTILLAAMMVLAVIPVSNFAYADDEIYVTEIAVYPREYTVYEKVDGVQTETDDGTTYYYYSPIFYDGDELRVAYSDESVVSYFFTSDQAVFAAFNGETVPLEDLEFISNQGAVNGTGKVTEWGVGIHSGSIVYMDESCEVSVEVLENPVKSISFKPTNFEIYQHSNGYWETKTFYYYDPSFRDGDTITVNFTDGTSAAYEYYKGDEAFVSDDGDEIMERDVLFVSEQDELLEDGQACWGIGNHTGHFEYMGCKSQDVTIIIKASTVNTLKYTPASVFEAAEKTSGSGMWLKDSKGDDYFYYFLPEVQEGDKLALTDADGNTSTYVGQLYISDDDRETVRFVNTENSNDVISGDNIFFCEEQDETHWSVGSKNYYWVEYQGIKSDKISATVVEKGTTPAGRSATRIYGQSRYETSLKIADAMKTSQTMKFDAIVLASGANFPDALAGSFLATGYEAPIILVNDANLDKVEDYIDRSLKLDGKIYILGGTGAVSAAVEERFASKFETIRLGGSTRYATNMEILKEGLQDSNLSKYTVIVCSGTGYADSLSASSTGQPILIVDPKKGLTDEQVEFLESYGANDFIVAGGESAVPRMVETKLKDLGTVDRIGGSNRYETSAMIATYFASDGAPNVVLAYGKNFPDGLCAGPLAWVKDANLILCENSNIKYAQEYIDDYSIVKGYITGGSSLISDNSVTTILKCNSIETFR